MFIRIKIKIVDWLLICKTWTNIRWTISRSLCLPISNKTSNSRSTRSKTNQKLTVILSSVKRRQTANISASKRSQRLIYLTQIKTLSRKYLRHYKALLKQNIRMTFWCRQRVSSLDVWEIVPFRTMSNLIPCSNSCTKVPHQVKFKSRHLGSL